MLKRTVTILLICFTLFALFGCAPIKPAALTPVRVVLDYLPNTNHTGLYVALKKGYYAEAGLDVSIVQPSEGTTATLIAMGQGEFGISYQEDVTYARASEEPLPVRAIAAILQHNDSGFATLRDDIASPKDFEGKTYGGWGSPGEEAVLRAVMEKQGADFSKLRVMTLQNGDLLGAMTGGEVDFGWIFYGWDGVIGKRQGLTLNYMALKDLHEALDYYTPVLIASDKLIADNPDMVRKFLAATSRGYMDCAKDPEGTAKILYEYAPEYELDMLIESQKHLAPNIVAEAPRWGEMKAGVWDAYTDFMLSCELISGPINVDSMLNHQFTNEFLPKK